MTSTTTWSLLNKYFLPETWTTLFDLWANAVAIYRHERAPEEWSAGDAEIARSEQWQEITRGCGSLSAPRSRLVVPDITAIMGKEPYSIGCIDSSERVRCGGLEGGIVISPPESLDAPVLYWRNRPQHRITVINARVLRLNTATTVIRW
jgi:hypothetical protein